MPSLDNPLITLGALAVAGQSSRGRQFTGGESGIGLLAGGFGSASASWAGTQLRNLTGQTGTDAMLSDPLAQALVGAGLSWADMVPANKALARGVHYNVVANAFRENEWTMGEFVGDLGSITSGTPSASATAETVSPSAASAPQRRGPGLQF